MKKYQILKGGYPSLMHGVFTDELLVQAEVKRLNEIAIAHNFDIQQHPAVGKGAAFHNILVPVNWSYKEV